MFCLKPRQSPLAPRCFLYWYTKLLSYQAYFVTHLQTILPPLVKQESLVPSRSTNKKHNNSCIHVSTYLCNWRLHPFWNTMDHLCSRVLYWRLDTCHDAMMMFTSLYKVPVPICPLPPHCSVSVIIIVISVSDIIVGNCDHSHQFNKQTNSLPAQFVKLSSDWGPGVAPVAHWRCTGQVWAIIITRSHPPSLS